MTDTSAGRNHAETVEGFLPPAQELVAFVITLHFEADVFIKGLIITKFIDRYGVVDNQIYRR